jgi:hypothetical protein
MTDEERWQKDLAEIKMIFAVLLFSAWVAFWWLVHHSYIIL